MPVADRIPITAMAANLIMKNTHHHWAVCSTLCVQLNGQVFATRESLALAWA